MAYASWSVVFGEQPSAAKWNILGSNDASFNDGSGFSAGALGSDSDAFANGVCVQMQHTSLTTVASTAIALPADDTIPQNTEGAEAMTVTITPKSSTNELVIEAVLLLAPNTADHVVAALFQDSTAGALKAVANYQSTNTGMTPVSLNHKMVAGTTSATTFKIRYGSSTGVSTSINGQGGARRFGGVVTTGMVVREYRAT